MDLTRYPKGGYFDFDWRYGINYAGYGFNLEGICSPWGGDYAQECEKGDVIKMTLNMIDLTLSFEINDIDYGKAFDIKQGKYKAVIGGRYDVCYELTSYTKIY